MLWSPNQFTRQEYADYLLAIEEMEKNNKEISETEDFSKTMTEEEKLEDEEFKEIHDQCLSL